jgi:hypothetical protein
MKVKVLVFTTIVMTAFYVVTIPANSDQSVTAAGGAVQGRLELECNLSDVDLYLCPKNNFSRKTVRSFFGLVKSHKDECSGDQFFLETTPSDGPVRQKQPGFFTLYPGDKSIPIIALIHVGLRPGMTAHGYGFINGGSLVSSLAAPGRQRQRATQGNKHKV